MSERTFLDEITIRSIGVIDQATLEISQGLTVLSGETGAGKTMILTALNLILGGKSDSALVRKGSERLIASGRFTVPLSSTKVFDECGVIVEDGELIITRSVTSDGKSKATSNGVSVTASTLTAVSQLLVEVHAQAANMHISKSTRQRELLDRYAGSDFNAAMTSHSDPQARCELVMALGTAAGARGMAGGQMIDMLAEARAHTNPLTGPEVTRLQALKTGKLIQYSAEAGAILGRASPTHRHQLAAYGRDLGAAFQIADDLLDAEGTTEETGKATGKDAAAGKATMVTILGLDMARTHADMLAQQAASHLDGFGPGADHLRALAAFVVFRRS